MLSIAKPALSSTDRPLRLLYANREPGSVIFDAVLAELRPGPPERCTVRTHFDSVSGYPSAGAVAEVVGDDVGAECFVCGPGPFMELVDDAPCSAPGWRPATSASSASRPGSGRPRPPPVRPTAPARPCRRRWCCSLQGRRHEVPYHAGDTVLETARRAGLAAPYSCEAGSCATCMALLTRGR